VETPYLAEGTSSYEDEWDIFYYAGDYTIDGTLYNQWDKYENYDYPLETMYTNIVVVNGAGIAP
jgi:hypothetical protein